MRVTCPHCGTIYRLTETVAARLPATLACVRCNESWLAQPEQSRLPQAASPMKQAAAAPVPSAPIPQPTVPPSSAVEAGSAAAAEPPLPPPFITPVAPMVMPLAPEVSSPAMTIPERFSEQPIKFDQAALLRPDPPSRARVAWLISLLAVAVLILLVVAFRTEISAAWPPSVRAYQAVGLTPRPIVKPASRRPAASASGQAVAPVAPSNSQAPALPPSHAP